MSKKTLLIFALLFVVVVPIASAETNSTSDSARPHPLKELRLENHEIAMENRVGFQELLQEKRLAMRSANQTEREEFKAKLAELKDQRKKTIVERIDLKLSTINQNGTQHLSMAIERLEKLLDKFKARAQKARTEGKNTTEVDAAITAAETAINSAKEAVATQAAKQYTAQITDETTLKDTVGKAVSSLRHDLHATFDVVKNAKQKVMDVARALAKLHSIDTTATPSATVAPGITVEPTI